MIQRMQPATCQSPLRWTPSGRIRVIWDTDGSVERPRVDLPMWPYHNAGKGAWRIAFETDGDAAEPLTVVHVIFCLPTNSNNKLRPNLSSNTLRR